jgi:scyllo-inositol 2-dehydrogenase (NADP+)
MNEKPIAEQPDIPILQVGIIGFGLSGKVFHAPFIADNPSFNLRSIVTTGTEAGRLYPKTRILHDYQSLLDDQEIDLVVVCTPSALHAKQAILAMQSGKHVVVEKPFAMNSTEVIEMMQTAKITGKLLFPYHNRRWDGDFQTVKHIINEGFLGKVIEYESRFERYNPLIARASWRFDQAGGGGTLFDLGPHLIDQAICLFGSPQAVSCRLLNQREGSKANDSFDLTLIYPQITVRLKAGLLIRESGPRFMVHGSLGSFIKYGADPQEDQLRKGKKPQSRNFGVDPRKNYGLLNSAMNGKYFRGKYETIPGDYMGFYNDVFAAIVNHKKQNVTTEDALLISRIIEAALKSQKEQRIVNFSD